MPKPKDDDPVFPEMNDRERRRRVKCDDPVKVKRSKHARGKGKRGEREARRILEAHGEKVHPVAASGAYAHGGHGDIRASDDVVEVKWWGKLPAKLEEALSHSDFVMLKGDGQGWRIYADAEKVLEWRDKWRERLSKPEGVRDV